MMATSTTETTPPNPLPNKKQRFNPARRRAAKAKSASASNQPEPSAVKTGAGIPSAQKSGVCPRPSNFKKTRSAPAVPSAKDAPKTISCKPHLQPKQLAGSQPEPHCADKHYENKVIALQTPASVLGGLAGCAASAGVLLAAGVWSQIAGTDSAILTARTSKIVINNLLEEAIINLKAGTYNAPEALDMLRRTTLVYASTMPGGILFVERFFREIDIVRRQRGSELDQTLVEARNDLASARKRGASASEMQMTVLRQLAKLSSFTSNATQDMMVRNPALGRCLGNQQIPTVRLNMNSKRKNAESTAA